MEQQQNTVSDHQTTIFGCKLVPLGLLVVLVPPIRDKIAWIDSTYFRTNWQNFDSWFEPNEVLFWGSDLVLLIVVKIDFQQYIICLCLHLFAKKIMFFERNYRKYQFNCLILGVGPTGTWNQELRPPSDSFRRHKSNGGLRILKRVFVRNHIFPGTFFRLDLHETLITWYLGLYFGNRAYLLTHVDK